MRHDGRLPRRSQLQAAYPELYKLSGNYRHECGKTLCNNTAFYNQRDADYRKENLSCQEFYFSRILATALAVCEPEPRFQQDTSFRSQIPDGGLQLNKIRPCVAFLQEYARHEYRPANPASAGVLLLLILGILHLKPAISVEHRLPFPRCIGGWFY